MPMRHALSACLTTQRRSHSRQPLPHSSLLTLTTHAARGHTRGATVRTRACAREPRTRQRVSALRDL